MIQKFLNKFFVGDKTVSVNKKTLKQHNRSRKIKTNLVGASIILLVVGSYIGKILLIF